MRTGAPKVLDILEALAFQEAVGRVIGGFRNRPKLQSRIKQLELEKGPRIALDELEATIPKRLQTHKSKDSKDDLPPITPGQLAIVKARLSVLADKGVFANPLADGSKSLSDPTRGPGRWH